MQETRTTTKQFFNGPLFTAQRLILAFVFAFTFINWLLLTMVEKIGPPDFYKIHEVMTRLFSGDLNVGIIPPLFPLLLYPLGKFISLFAPQQEAFIIAGRIISLAAALGLLYFTYRFMEKVVGTAALLGLLFFVVSPWFLKLLAFPITDMLYLFFVSVVFYSFLVQSSPWWSAAAILGGVLTRFEGVLLFLSGFVNYFKFKKRNIYILLAFIPPALGVLWFFRTYASRFFAHFTDIILPQKTYLYVFQHPLEFMNVIYGNVLFFIPHTYPYVLKMFLLVVVLCCFVYGFYRLYKLRRSLGLALLVYELLFLVAKGYINPEDPGREFRRILSGLWLFYVVAFIGGCFLVKKLAEKKTPARAVLAAAGILLTALTVSLPIIPIPELLPVLLLIPVLVVALKDFPAAKIPRIALLLVLLLFTFQIYHVSYTRSQKYLDSYANKAAYAAAQWLNLARLKQDCTVLSYTNNTMVNYYVDKAVRDSGKFRLIHFTVPLRNVPESRDQYIRIFFDLLKEHHVDYILFDNYVVRKPEFLGINDVQRLLYEEKENNRLFRVKRNLFYKRKNVGYVLKPVDVQTNH